MNQAQLDRAEERMEQKWYDLVMAEQRGDSTRSLERIYNAYMLAVEEYNRLLAILSHSREGYVEYRERLAS